MSVMCGLPVCAREGSLVLVLGFQLSETKQSSMKYERKSNVMEMAA